ncbi:MAG: hypothetical protein ACLQU1_23640 [Bryobacteraceae bacterium]
MECPFCRKTIDDRATVCNGCGAFVTRTSLFGRVRNGFGAIAGGTLAALALAFFGEHLFDFLITGRAAGSFTNIQMRLSFTIAHWIFWIILVTLFIRRVLREPGQKWVRRP